MRNNCIVEVSDLVRTCYISEIFCFFFDCFEDELLTVRPIKITRRVTAASIFECSLSIECLESFFHRKCRISPVIIGVLSVDEILWDIDIDSSEDIDHFFKSRKINHDVLVDLLSCDLSHLISEIFDPNFISFSEVVERIDTSGTSLFSIGYVEVTRDGEECYMFSFTVETREHDRVGEVSPIMSLSSDTRDEDIGSSLYFFIYKFFDYARRSIDL